MWRFVTFLGCCSLIYHVLLGVPSAHGYWEDDPAYEQVLHYSGSVVRVEPYDFGPVMQQYSFSGFKQHVARISNEFEWLAKDRKDDGCERHPDAWLAQCYRWARHANPTLTGKMTCDFEIDDWGVIVNVKCTHAAEMKLLVSCIKTMLTEVRIMPRYTPRTTTAVIPFEFLPEKQSLPTHRRSLPRTEKFSRKSVARIKTYPSEGHDRIYLDTIRVSDFSWQQHIKEQLAAYHKALTAWKRGGGKGGYPFRPFGASGFCGRANVSAIPGHHRYRDEVISFNMGAYRKCAKSFFANPYMQQSATEVSYTIEVNRIGTVARVKNAEGGHGDNQLDRCMHQALYALRFEWMPIKRMFVTIPFLLTPLSDGQIADLVITDKATAEQKEIWVTRNLKNLNGEKVQQQLLRWIKADPNSKDQCKWRGLLFIALKKQFPWVDQQVKTAAATFAAFLKNPTISPSARQACLNAFADEITELANTPHLYYQSGFRQLLPEISTRYQLVTSFPFEPVQLSKLYYYWGEFAFTTEDWQKSAALYDRSLTIYPRTTFAAEARYAQIIAQRNLIQQLGDDPKATPAKNQLFKNCLNILKRTDLELHVRCELLRICLKETSPHSRKAHEPWQQQMLKFCK